MGVAEGAEKISRFMGFDEDICQKMYIAGALHDIGKVAIGNEILEKPDKLTDEEIRIYKRGRNAKSVTMAKNATISDYKKATGFEALMGYLYLNNETDRMLELMKSGLDYLEKNEK